VKTKFNTTFKVIYLGEIIANLSYTDGYQKYTDIFLN
jgi:hypothetical protein